MTLEEASKQYRLNPEDLQYYEKSGLLKFPLGTNGLPDYQTMDLKRIGFISYLLDSDLELNELKRFLMLLENDKETKDEQLRILKKRRYQLLDNIHSKQQILDRLDYFIHQIKML